MAGFSDIPRQEEDSAMENTLRDPHLAEKVVKYVDCRCNVSPEQFYCYAVYTRCFARFYDGDGTPDLGFSYGA